MQTMHQKLLLLNSVKIKELGKLNKNLSFDEFKKQGNLQMEIDRKQKEITREYEKQQKFLCQQ